MEEFGHSLGLWTRTCRSTHAAEVRIKCDVGDIELSILMLPPVFPNPFVLRQLLRRAPLSRLPLQHFSHQS